jgi:hypothetical protein
MAHADGKIEKPSTTLPGTVQKIIKPVHPEALEQVEITASILVRDRLGSSLSCFTICPSTLSFDIVCGGGACVSGGICSLSVWPSSGNVDTGSDTAGLSSMVAALAAGPEPSQRGIRRRNIGRSA